MDRKDVHEDLPSLAAEQYLAKLPGVLKNERKANQFTQKEIAEKLNISQQAYQTYEKGKTVPSLANFIQLAEIYKVPLDELIDRHVD